MGCLGWGRRRAHSSPQAHARPCVEGLSHGQPARVSVMEGVDELSKRPVEAMDPAERFADHCEGAAVQYLQEPCIIVAFGVTGIAIGLQLNDPSSLTTPSPSGVFQMIRTHHTFILTLIIVAVSLYALMRFARRTLERAGCIILLCEVVGRTVWCIYKPISQMLAGCERVEQSPAVQLGLVVNNALLGFCVGSIRPVHLSSTLQLATVCLHTASRLCHANVIAVRTGKWQCVHICLHMAFSFLASYIMCRLTIRATQARALASRERQ